MARQPSARHRRRKRFTPRRWLPFVALTAVIVAAIVYDSVSTESDEPDPRPAPELASVGGLDLTAWPMVTSSEDISTAWYCGGGTAQGDGLAELSIVVANDDVAGASAEVTIFDEDGPAKTETVDVPARGRARIAASDLAEAEWVGALVEIRGGRVAVDQEVSGPLGFDSSPCSTEAADRWYLPSGSTVRGSEMYISLFNPFPGPASVDITFATDSGQRRPRALTGLSVDGQSVKVVKVNDSVTDRSALAATIRTRVGRVVADRVQTFDGNGDSITSEGEAAKTYPAPKGLVSTIAIPVRAPRWVFPGSRIIDGVRNEVAVFNPSGSAAEVDLVLTPQDPEANSEIEPYGITVRAHEQAVVDLGDIPGVPADTDMWVDVRSINGVSVVAERLTFVSPPSERVGASATAGLPMASTQWLITQGGPSRSRSSSVAIANPGQRDAKLTVYQLTRGTRVELTEASVTVKKGDRTSLVLDQADPAATLVIASSEPVVVMSSSSEVSGTGIATQPAFAFPEAVVALPATR